MRKDIDMGICYNIVRPIARLSTSIDKNGDRWTNELNLMTWNNGRLVFDVREWDENHDRCRVGVKLDYDEMKNLVKGFMDYKEWQES